MKDADVGLLLHDLRLLYGDDFCRVTAAMYDSNVRSFGITCKNVGVYLSHSEKKPPEGDRGVDSVKNRLRRITVSEPDNGRPAYEACSHEDPCTDKRTCICVAKGLPCEKYCGCNLGRVCGDRVQSRSIFYCHRLFVGCDCKSATVCRTNSCECFFNFRECDHDLCTSCTSCETRADGKPVRHCRNSDMRMKKHHRVAIGRSRVHGWGVYSTDRIPKGDLIGEYVGEVIPHDLAERRGRVYDVHEHSFLFSSAKDFSIDSMRMGNKLRYCNHCENPNCTSKLVRVGGDVRIGLYAIQAIEPFEEILYDYGQNFFQEGRQQAEKAGAKRDAAAASAKTARPGPSSRPGPR